MIGKTKLYCVLLIVALGICLNTCNVAKKESVVITKTEFSDTKAIALPQPKMEVKEQTKLSDIEKIVIEAGLVKIKDYDSTIKIDLKYASLDNFLKINMYGDFKEGYLQEPVAKQLAKAANFLKDTFPGYSLIVYDAVRPVSIQKLMWDSIKVPKETKSFYVSNPAYGSLHNYGAAVDVSIVDAEGKELDMGTSYDSFEQLAYPVLENKFLKNGLLSKQQVANRRLLRSVMQKALFSGISTEWWHFNACSNKQAKIFYPLIKQHSLRKKSKVQLENTDNAKICFKVQIKVSDVILDSTSVDFKGLHVDYYFHNGLYKYVTGSFQNIEAAYSKQEIVNNLGFKDAFVVAFNNNKRIEVKEAILLMP